MQRPLLLGILATAFWASNFDATRIALESLAPLTAASLRFVIATIAIMTLLACTEGLALAPLRRNLLAFPALGILGVAGFNAALCIGLQSSSPLTGALIMATTPLSSTLLESLLTRKWPAVQTFCGMALSLFGVALVLGRGHFATIGAMLTPGDLVIFAGSLAWAAYGVGCKRFVKDASPLAISSWTMLFGTIALVLTSLTEGNPLRAAWRAAPDALLASLWMGIVGSALAYIFWTIAIAGRGVARTAILFNLVPVFAMLIGWGIGRAPAPLQILGTAITILGVALTQMRLSRLTARPSRGPIAS
ncbi:DMT family transporter [Thioclava sp. GXIMD4215]|uniref:DMT family transporter n=1 Tax=Thioclava sp. GXIMD4215 TaxID=3131928 RepID=UPI0032518F59